MSNFNCQQHSEQWPLKGLYTWFAQAVGNATAEVSNPIGDNSIVVVEAVANQYTRQITVEDVNDLLGKVSYCSNCIKDLFSQAKQFSNPNSETKSTVGAFLYTATAYDRAQKVTDEGIELEKIQEILDQALGDYQKSHEERCLHSVIKYHNVDVVNYLINKDPNWNKCSLGACFLHKISENQSIPEKILSLLRKSSSDKYIIDQEDWKVSLSVENINEVSSMPQNMYAILENDCPFIRGKKVRDTHILVFFPSYIRNEGKFSPFNFTMLEELIESVHLKLDLTMEARDTLGNPLIEEPYWLLMTKSFIPDTAGKTLDYQIKQLSREKMLEFNYEAPCALEAVAGILIYYACTQKFLFPNSMTRCSCSLSGQGKSIVVGVYESRELCVDIGSSLERKNEFGLIGVRRFPTS